MSDGEWVHPAIETAIRIERQRSTETVDRAVQLERERCARYIESFAAGYQAAATGSGHKPEFEDDVMVSTLAFLAARLREPPPPTPATPPDRYLDKFGHL